MHISLHCSYTHARTVNYSKYMDKSLCVGVFLTHIIIGFNLRLLKRSQMGSAPMYEPWFSGGASYRQDTGLGLGPDFQKIIRFIT